MPGHAPGQAAENRCVAYLRAHARTYFCVSCLAARVDLSLQETQEVVSGFHRFKDFDVRRNECSACGRSALAVCAR